MIGRRILQVLIFGVAGLLFIWTIVLKIVSRLADRFGQSAPCPASLAWLVDNPVRRWYMRPVHAWLGIQSGERVLELGPGPGAFTLDAAQKLGRRGWLLAVDIQPQMITQVKKRLLGAGISNVHICVADACHLPLPDHRMDRAFLVSVLPEIPDQDQALAEMRRVLGPEAVLSITAEFLDPDYRFMFEVARQLREAGFQEDERFGNLWRYTINFRLART